MPMDLLQAGPPLLTTSPCSLRHALDQAMGSAMESSVAAHNALLVTRYVDHMLQEMTRLLPTEIGGHKIDYSRLPTQSLHSDSSQRTPLTQFDGAAHEFIAYKPRSSVDILTIPRLADELVPHQDPLTLTWSPYEEKHPNMLPRHDFGAFDADNYHIDVGKP